MGQTLGVFEPAADAARTPSAPGGFCWTPKALESVSRQFRSNSVSCEADVVCSITLPVRKHKGAGSPERQRIVDACRKCFLLADMDLVVLYSLVDAMTARHVKQGEVVIREGASGDCLYVVDHGAFRASQTAGRRHVFKYDGSGAFGELSLMYDAPRAATVKALSDGLLWRLGRDAFRSVVVTHLHARRCALDAVLRTVPLFAGMEPQRRAKVADCLVREHHPPGSVILAEGEHLTAQSKFYVIESGRVDCFKAAGSGCGRSGGGGGSGGGGCHVKVASLSAGDTFGEWALVEGLPRNAQCVAAAAVAPPPPPPPQPATAATAAAAAADADPAATAAGDVGCCVDGGGSGGSGGGSGSGGDHIGESTVVLGLSRDAFERLLGPLDQVFRRQIEEYKEQNARIEFASTAASAAAAAAAAAVAAAAAAVTADGSGVGGGEHAAPEGAAAAEASPGAVAAVSGGRHAPLAADESSSRL